MSTPTEIVLVRATELTGRPVVSVSEGEALADVKDVLYSPEDGRVTGFTLNKRGGLFAGPLKVGLPLESVLAIGRDAVTVASSAVLNGGGAREVRDRAAGERHRDVVGNQVLTDGGDRLGQVTDLVLQAGVMGRGSVSSAPGDVVGYQLHADGAEDLQQFVPLPYTLAVSGTNLVVPAEVRPFIRDDLSGFGGAVDSFRAQLGEPPTVGAAPGGSGGATMPADPAPASEPAGPEAAADSGPAESGPARSAGPGEVPGATPPTPHAPTPGASLPGGMGP